MTGFQIIHQKGTGTKPVLLEQNRDYWNKTRATDWNNTGVTGTTLLFHCKHHLKPIKNNTFFNQPGVLEQNLLLLEQNLVPLEQNFVPLEQLFCSSNSGFVPVLLVMFFPVVAHPPVSAASPLWRHPPLLQLINVPFHFN